jgi:hypothetical protein
MASGAWAVGFGGRDRRVSSASERARIRVTNAIRGALARIEQYSPDLGAHLRASIKTGAICSYRPDPGVSITWRLNLAPADLHMTGHLKEPNRRSVKGDA